MKSKKSIAGPGHIAFGKSTTSFFNKPPHEDKENINENNIQTHHEDESDLGDIDVDHH
jgi:hypothetical protein